MVKYKSPSSAATIGGSENLLTEIFLLCPAKSLIRFKLVSKQWRSLISSPNFYHLHRRQEHQQSFILSGESGKKYYIFNPTIKRLVPFRLEYPYVRIVQSCNGLLLLRCGNCPYGIEPQDYCIYNPTTKQSRVLLKDKYWPRIHLFFDPLKSPHYRVFCCADWEDNLFTYSLVYDSQTHTWEKVRAWNEIRSFVFLNGYNWNDGIYDIRFSGPSVCFHLDRGFRRIVPSPQTSTSVLVDKYPMVSNGHMHYVVLSRVPNDYSLTVYEMYSDESGWFLKYQADFTPISAEVAKICLVGMIRGEREEDSMLVFHVPGKIMIYKFLEKIFEVIVDFRKEDYFVEGKLQFPYLENHPFIESFAPV